MKAAFAALVGRPSAGKSSLVNKLCKAKVAITAAVPQTTRNAIRGVYTCESGQLVFVDTPGRHSSDKKLNKKLTEVSERAIEDCDIVVYVIDSTRPAGGEETAIAARLKELQGQTVVVINKIDLPESNEKATREFIRENLNEIPDERIIPFTCVKTDEKTADAQKQKLTAALFALAGEGDKFYPDDVYTDQEVGFRIAEIIREKAIVRLRQELPHSIYVETADLEMHESESGKRELWARCFIITERESQKGMIVGSGGSMIKAIREAAQKDLNRIFDQKVKLDLRVKTGKDWRRDDRVLRRLIK